MMIIVVKFYRYKPSMYQTFITERVTIDFGVLSAAVGAVPSATTGLNRNHG